ncbi:MAG: hypothetical protein R3Y68_09005 [Rikenellaceae bacterium]
MTRDQHYEDLSNNPAMHRDRAEVALDKGKELQRKREKSGKWEWVQIDGRTRVFRKKIK